MERLEAALQEALARNDDETNRWTKYKEEQETAISNLKIFRDKLSVDVMVPVGSKAFMPGYLYHTNEILVSHSSEIFSQVTSQQAQDIAKFRINRAEERLINLEKEREMYQNKLDKPHTEGVLPRGEEREIIEEYDEEKEKLWRIEHRRRVREEKIKESQKQTATDAPKSHEDVIELLDTLEMMEELEDELNKLKVEDDDMLEKLILGEIKPPEEKRRKSHYTEKNVVIGSADKDDQKRRGEKQSIEQTVDETNTLNNKDRQEKVDFTNNNTVPNTEDYQSDDDTSSNSTEDIPEAVLKIEADAKHLSVAQKIKYFKKKLKEVEKELLEIKVKSVEDIDEKMNKMEVREYLCDYIELLQDEIQDELQDKSDEIINTKSELVEPQKKKRITFADKDEVQLIDKNKAANTVTRSKIELSDESYKALNLKPPSSLSKESDAPSEVLLLPQVDKKKEILEKVEKSFEFVSEHQSQQDFNLIDKIVDCSESNYRTLHINFQHSSSFFKYPGYETDALNEEKVIASPADIYEKFREYFPAEVQNKSARTISSNTYETNVSNGYIPEKFIDITPPKDNITGEPPKSMINNSKNNEAPDNRNGPSIINSSELVKSILKNKEKVKEETITAATNKLQHGKPQVEIGGSSVDLIMGEVVERNKSPNPPLEENKNIETEDKRKDEPDPLPTEKFIDAHAPKKRISRFKQMRANS